MVTNCLSLLVKGHQYKFHLARLEVGNDSMSNRKSSKEMKLGIESSRGPNKKRNFKDDSPKKEPKKKKKNLPRLLTLYYSFFCNS